MVGFPSPKRTIRVRIPTAMPNKSVKEKEMDESLDKALGGVFALSALLFNIQATSWKGLGDKEKADLTNKWVEDSVTTLKSVLDTSGFVIVKKEPALENYPK